MVHLSPRAILSQCFRNLHTLPIPTVSSHLWMCSLRRPTSLFHTAPIHCLRPSFSLCRSIALVRATSDGAMCPIPGAHSTGKTHRSTKTFTGGRTAKRRERRMETRDRASLRDTTVVFVRKMERLMSSERDGRNREERETARTVRERRLRRKCRIGAIQRQRNWWDVCNRDQPYERKKGSQQPRPSPSQTM